MDRPILINEIDWACMDEGLEIEDHLLYWQVMEAPDPDAESGVWAEAAVTANPGIWIAALCRLKHGQPDIKHCGLCKEYANPRKRARAAHLGPVLPGFESIGGEFQLYPPCSRHALTWLRKLARRLHRERSIDRRTEQIPDDRQARGWDWGTRLYPGAAGLQQEED